MPDAPPLPNLISHVLFSEETMQRRIAELGAAISKDYAGKKPHLVGVLKSVIVFMADLMRAITIPMTVDFIAISSYGPAARAHGAVRLTKDLDQPIAGRHVIFVEDVIDTGLTLSYLLHNLRAREPASLQVCVLFNRPQRRLIETPLAYSGFDVPDQYLVGYGLDYQQRYRHLPYVGVLREEQLVPQRAPRGLSLS
ncbi:MAG: hypoxanthine phosphoribosyltransferase [Anaerolineae bacterium]|nr:hypoxanthine phosphoribosyltransferase [Anaerolineae bacterium]